MSGTFLWDGFPPFLVRRLYRYSSKCSMICRARSSTVEWSWQRSSAVLARSERRNKCPSHHESIPLEGSCMCCACSLMSRGELSLGSCLVVLGSCSVCARLRRHACVVVAFACSFVRQCLFRMFFLITVLSSFSVSFFFFFFVQCCVKCISLTFHRHCSSTPSTCCFHSC